MMNILLKAKRIVTTFIKHWFEYKIMYSMLNYTAVTFELLHHIVTFEKITSCCNIPMLHYSVTNASLKNKIV